MSGKVRFRCDWDASEKEPASAVELSSSASMGDTPRPSANNDGRLMTRMPDLRDLVLQSTLPAPSRAFTTMGSLSSIVNARAHERLPTETPPN